MKHGWVCFVQACACAKCLVCLVCFICQANSQTSPWCLTVTAGTIQLLVNMADAWLPVAAVNVATFSFSASVGVLFKLLR